MGVLPLQFKDGEGWKALGMTGDEVVSIANVAEINPRGDVEVLIKFADGTEKTIIALCRIDTENEMEYFRNGGILQYVLRNLVAE
jgi:aconitate hydratase